MAVKSDVLMRMEEVGIFWQDKKTGKWFNRIREDIDLTPYFFRAGLFEH